MTISEITMSKCDPASRGSAASALSAASTWKPSASRTKRSFWIWVGLSSTIRMRAMVFLVPLKNRCQPRRDGRQRQHMIDDTGVDRRRRHSENDRTRFILGDDPAAEFANGAKPVDAV